MLSNHESPEPTEVPLPLLLDFLGRDGTLPIKALLAAGLGSHFRGRIDLVGNGCAQDFGDTNVAAALADIRVCHFHTYVIEPEAHKGKQRAKGERISGYRLIQQIGLREVLQNLESTPMARGMKLEDDARHEAIELWL